MSAWLFWKVGDPMPAPGRYAVLRRNRSARFERMASDVRNGLPYASIGIVQDSAHGLQWGRYSKGKTEVCGYLPTPLPTIPKVVP